MNKRQLAERLRQQRDRVALSQGELARRTKTSQSQVSRWEDALSVPSAAKLPALAEALELDLAELSMWVADASQDENRHLRRENQQLERAIWELLTEVRLFMNETREFQSDIRSRLP